MAINTVIFDQVYRMLEAVRTQIRTEYDTTITGNRDETVYFLLDIEKETVIRGDESDRYTENVGICTVSHDNRNSDLRTLARDVMSQLLEG